MRDDERPGISRRRAWLGGAATLALGGAASTARAQTGKPFRGGYPSVSDSSAVPQYAALVGRADEMIE